MEKKSNILNILKQSNKGKLAYDKDWFDKGRTKAILEQFTSTPALSVRSPQQQVEHSNDNVHSSTTTPVTPQLTEVSPVPNQSTVSTTINTLLSQRNQEAVDAAEQVYAERRHQFEAHTELLLQQAQSQLYELNFRLDETADTQLQHILQQEQAREVELKKKQLRLKENHRQHAKSLNNKMHEAHRQQKEEQQLRLIQQQESSERAVMMTRLLTEVRQLYDKARHVLSSCGYLQYVCDATQKSPQLIMQVYDRIVQETKSSDDMTPENVKLAAAATAQARQIFHLLSTQIAEANKTGKDILDKEEKDRLEKQKQEDERKKRQQEEEERKKKDAAVAKQNAKSALVLKAGDVQCVTQDAMQSYEELQKKLLATEKEYQNIVTDNNLKKYKFGLQKAVNTAINAIAATSASHLQDKLQRILALFSGQPVDCGGVARSANDIPGGMAFCKDLFAKKIVKQGDEQISSSHESAFAVAAVAIGVWCQHADVGDLILGHLYRKCPYIVPYYLPKQQGQSREDYYRSLGYECDSSGQLEKQDKFLRRMTGLMWLYAALLVTPAPHRSRAPYGLEHGWRWLCRILSVPPRIDITATMMLAFLQVAGSSLRQTYGHQFVKLLHVVSNAYVPKLKSLSSVGGPVTRLDSFLKAAAANNGHIDAPDGRLAPNFW